MRVAVVSQLNSPGGGSRFLRGLLLGLLAHTETVERVGLFVDAAAIGRDGIDSLMEGHGERLTVHAVDEAGQLADAVGTSGSHGEARPVGPTLRDWLREWPPAARAWRFVKFRILGAVEPPVVDAALRRLAFSDGVLGLLDTYDVVYFAWPRGVVAPAVSCALVGTFHDFNWRHSFGNFSPEAEAFLDAEAAEWLRGDVQPICSTRFIAQELDRFYPQRTHAPEVVYLSSFALHDPGEDQVAEALSRLGVERPYVVCPSNISPHKNLTGLLRAAGILKRQGRGIRLVVTGAGTRLLTGDPQGDPLYATRFGAIVDHLNHVIDEEHLVRDDDLLALGYVSDPDMDALIKGAALVAAPSRYEAGSGPALDAWKLSTPIATSSIPPVLEQLEALGTEAVAFDESDPEDIARALAEGLRGSGDVAGMLKRSKAAIDAYGWSDVAERYVAVFSRAIERGRSGGRVQAS
jgi:glycosyltransferase involved in cell wall biosynthesis